MDPTHSTHAAADANADLERRLRREDWEQDQEDEADAKELEYFNRSSGYYYATAEY